jgi:hypothetical protein
MISFDILIIKILPADRKKNRTMEWVLEDFGAGDWGLVVRFGS